MSKALFASLRGTAVALIELLDSLAKDIEVQGDPYAYLKMAHAEGHPIEFLSLVDGAERWIPCPEPTWTAADYLYRKAPENFKSENRYQVFRDALDCGDYVQVKNIAGNWGKPCNDPDLFDFDCPPSYYRIAPDTQTDEVHVPLTDDSTGQDFTLTLVVSTIDGYVMNATVKEFPQ